jgi:sugar phosphate permease
MFAAFSSGPGQSYVFSIVIDPILRDTGLSRTALSGLYAAGTVVSAMMAFGVSRLVDRLGARIMLGLVGLALGTACVGLAMSAGPAMLFVSFAALRALGQGSLPVTANLLTAQWFVRYRGRAIALVSLGLALSNAVLPPMVRWLVTLVDWRGAYLVLAVMVWVLVVPAAVMIVRNRPEDLGLHPDGGLEPPTQEHPQETTASAPSSLPVFRSRLFWSLALPLSATPFVVTALVFHQVSIFAELGLSANVAASVFVPFAISAAGTTALAGFLIERLPPKRLIITIQVLLMLALLQLQLISTPVAGVLYAITLGAASGMQGVTSGVTWAYYYGRRGLGRVHGTATMVMISGAALAPLPLAAFQQWSVGYALGLALLLGIPLGCAFIAALAPSAAHSGVSDRQNTNA